jgi:chromosome segregation ATPase
MASALAHEQSLRTVLHEAHEAVRTERACLEVEIGRLRVGNTEHNEALDRLNKQHATAAKHSRGLQEALEKHRADARDALDDAQREHTRLTRRLALFERQADERAEASGKRAAESERLLADAHATAEIRAAEAARQHNAFQRERAAASEEAQDALSALAAARTEASSLASANGDLQRVNDNIAATAKRNEGDLASTQLRLQSAEDDREQLRVAVAALRKELQGCQDRQAEMGRSFSLDRDSQAALLSSERDQLSQRQAEVARLLAHAEALQRRLGDTVNVAAVAENDKRSAEVRLSSIVPHGQPIAISDLLTHLRCHNSDDSTAPHDSFIR